MWFRDGFYGVEYISDWLYIVTEPETMIEQYTVPATRADYSETQSPFDIPMKSLVANYAHGEAEIDPAGNLLSLDVTLAATIEDIFGEISTLDGDFSVRFSEIGTSNPACPIPGAEFILTSDNMKAWFGSTDASVFFLLNDDGSIDVNSITTTYPGESTRNHGTYFGVSQSASDMPSLPIPPAIGE
jgi:hypothetical protein